MNTIYMAERHKSQKARYERTCHWSCRLHRYPCRPGIARQRPSSRSPRITEPRPQTGAGAKDPVRRIGRPGHAGRAGSPAALSGRMCHAFCRSCLRRRVGGATADVLRQQHGRNLILAQSNLPERVPKFVFSSTCATYGEPTSMPISEDAPQQPINPYGASKLFSERMIRDLRVVLPGFACALLRYSTWRARPATAVSANITSRRRI